jgi:hypothetical protein
VNPAENAPVGLIWATRGRFWGFRFLLDGGLSDPLAAYERAFTNLRDDPAAWLRSAAEEVALRFPDPSERRDVSGRVIPHEFVVFGDLAASINSVEDGLRLLWPLVAEAYAQVWDAEGSPSAQDLRFSP